MSSKVDMTNSPFSRGNVFLLIFTLNIDISLVSQSSGERPDDSMIDKIALAIAMHGVDESALEAAAVRLLRPPPAERAGKKVVLLRALVADGVVVDGVVVNAAARLRTVESMLRTSC
jgi:hypothetical protein